MKEPDLLDAIARHPEAIEPYSVYGDWLTERGDPRGEWIALQVELARSPHDLGLRSAERDMLGSQGEELLGACAVLAARGVLQIEWRCGFIRSVRFEGAYDPEHHTQIYGRILRGEFLQDLLKHPSARLIEKIEIGDWWVARDRVFDVDAAAIARAPKTLRSIRIRPVGARDASGRLFGLGPMLAAHPQLVELDLAGIAMEFPHPLELPRLERLSVLEHSTSDMTCYGVVMNRWPALIELSIAAGGAGYSRDVLLPVLTGERLPRLESLSLCGAVVVTDSFAEAIARSPLLSRLDKLELSRTKLDDLGARAFVRRREAFAHLQRLTLDDNQLTAQGVAAVRGLACPVIIGTQRGIRYD